MGRAGPTNQPAEIAKLKGYYRPSRHGDEIAETDSLIWVYKNNIPLAPEHLRPDAQDIWNRMLLQSSNLHGYISGLDLTLFEEFCYVYAEIKFLKKKVRTARTYVNRKTGVRMVNPLYLELNKLRKDYIRLCQEFGFSPSARTRIKLDPKTDVPHDDFGDF